VQKTPTQQREGGGSRKQVSSLIFMVISEEEGSKRMSGLCDGLKKLIAFFGLSSTLVVVEYLAASLVMI
jgi:hypothetical protein